MSYTTERNSLHLMITAPVFPFPPNVRTNMPLNGTFVANAGLVTFGATTFTFNFPGVYTIAVNTYETLAAPFEAWSFESFYELILFTPVVNAVQREFGDSPGAYSATNIQLTVGLTARFAVGDTCNITMMPFNFALSHNCGIRSLSIIKVSD